MPHSLDTHAVHVGPEDRVDGAVVHPVFQTAMYEYRGREGEEVRYIRYGNTPNHRAVERKLAALEGGGEAMLAASGMAAISTTLLSVLRPGDRVLAQPGLYGGTHDFFTRALPAVDVSVDFLEGEDPGHWEAQLSSTTRVVYVESISNPLMEVTDLEAVARFARAHDLLSVVDNTFATPVNFRPREHGYDVVVHSGTKYLNGHSDVVAGAVVAAPYVLRRVRKKMKQLGGSLDPHACFLLERGMKTLAVRVTRQNRTALRLARFLEDHPGVARVHHPGLESHAGHDRAARLFDGFGGMLSFEPAGGTAAAEGFLDRVTIPVVAPSLGGVESLVTRPAVTSHRDMDPEERRELGIVDELVRVSVGIEGADDLVADFGQALEGAGG